MQNVETTTANNLKPTRIYWAQVLDRELKKSIRVETFFHGSFPDGTLVTLSFFGNLPKGLRPVVEAEGMESAYLDLEESPLARMEKSQWLSHTWFNSESR